MKKNLLNQLIATALILASVYTVSNLPANAEMKTENGKTYNYNELGQKLKGWVLDAGNWYYFNENGEMQKNTTVSVDGKDYKFDENGILMNEYQNGTEVSRTGFVYGTDDKFENGKIYYYDNGKKTGWVDVSGKTYYYNEKGEMQKNTTIKDLNGKEVKLNENGVVVGEHGYEILMGMEVNYDSSEAYKNSHKQWKKVGIDWYCYTGSDLEDMVTDSWWQDNGVWYYFNNAGIMQKNTTIKDGKGNDCILNADGALTNRSEPEMDTSKLLTSKDFSWKKVDGNWYYMASNGQKETGWIKDRGDGKWYYCNKDGLMQRNTTIVDDNIQYILGADGAWVQ